MTAPPHRSRTADTDTDADELPRGDRAGGYRQWLARARQHRSQLESRPRLGLPFRALRRFREIDGQHLALVIAANLFIAIIPLLILGYAIFVEFNPDRSSVSCWCTPST